jgi:deazaflavin-dependent oxidoreductase (nitroreductase family)
MSTETPNGTNRPDGSEGEYAPSPEDYVRETVELYESSGGTQGSTMMGKPIIILTTVGNKSGKLRKTPLMRVEHDGKYAVVASLGGAPKNPVWYYNIVANPEVQLQDGPTKKTYIAHEATGAEKDEWWARAVEAWPDYANYQAKTDRVIPLFVLEPR